MLDSLETRLMEATHEAVMRSVGREAPASGLTLILDLRHPIAPLIATHCGASQEQIDAQVRLSNRRGGLPWNVCWIADEVAFRLFASQNEAGAAELRNLFASAANKGTHVIALIIKGRRVVRLVTYKFNA